MPYKHKNIEYGLPHERYPKERVEESLETLKGVLGLEAEPVGITLLFTKEDYDQYPVEETKSAMPYCVMVKQAAMRETAIKSRLEHDKCDGATTALACEPVRNASKAGRNIFLISCILLWQRQDVCADRSKVCIGCRYLLTGWR